MLLLKVRLLILSHVRLILILSDLCGFITTSIAEGNFKCQKSRMVANGKCQAHGVDFDETYSPIVKPAMIRTILHVALTND